MAKSTINAKTPKAELIAMLRKAMSSKKLAEDENLKSRVDYTMKSLDKDEKSVAKSDLFDLVKELVAFFSATPTPAPVENSPKPALKGKKKAKAEEAEEADEAEDEDDEAEEVEEKPKKQKKAAKSKKPEKSKVETAEDFKKGSIMAKMFPAEIQTEELGHLVACYDKYTTMAEVREALEQGKTLIFATFWTKRHIKQFGYSMMFNVPVPKEFPFDLDMLQALYVCDNIDRLYALSSYTEAMFEFLEEDLARVDVESNDGNTYSMRYSAGLEFEIYEVVEDKETEAE